MAVRPSYLLLGVLIANVLFATYAKHVIVKRDLIEDDVPVSEKLSLDTIEDTAAFRSQPQKRDLLSQSPYTHVVSPGKIVDEEAEEDSDPDGDDEASGDVSGSGFQREIVTEADAEDADGDSENTDQNSEESNAEHSEDTVENSESSNVNAMSESAGADPATEDNKETKRQFIAHPHSRFYSHPGYVYLKAPPIRQKTIVTTRIPRPPIMMSYKQFLRRLAHERMHGFHAPSYHAEDSDDDDYDREREHDEGICTFI